MKFNEDKCEYFWVEKCNIYNCGSSKDGEKKPFTLYTSLRQIISLIYFASLTGIYEMMYRCCI